MARHGGWVGIAVFVLALWGTGCPARSEDPKLCRSYADPVILGTVKDKRLTEISGIAVSEKNPGVIWVHNDSGDGAFVYAMTRAGEALGRLTLSGATARDWEDMTLAPCGEDWCLLLGDIGDNDRHRHDAAVYRIVEPAIDVEKPFGEISASPERVPFDYPDRPRDAEALFWHRGLATLFILSKEPDGKTHLYRFPALVHGQKVTLEKLAEIPTKIHPKFRVTAADLNRTGERLIVRTYDSVWEYAVDPKDFVESLTDASRRDRPSPSEEQGEAIAYDPIDGGYLTIGEGAFPPINYVGCE